MTEHPTAAFADQIQPGMVIDPSPHSLNLDGDGSGPKLVTITGVRRVDHGPDDSGFLGPFGTRIRGPRITIHLIGHHADGAPYGGSMADWCTVHVHAVPAVPDTAEGAAR